MTIQTLADRDQPVTEADLEECVNSSYCRCTGYVNIRRAARQALGLDQEGENGHD